MDLLHLTRIVWRRWWVVVAIPLVVLLVGFWLTSDPPYESRIRATILIPGDTEIPGNAERPELMVLDDAPVLVGSRAFAEMVHAELQDGPGDSLSVDDVHGALNGERYSRILTVIATRDDAAQARAIADAVATILPDAVNQYLVAPCPEAATVKVIDPPSEPALANENRWLILAVETFVALVVAVGVAILVDSVLERRAADPVSEQPSAHAPSK